MFEELFLDDHLLISRTSSPEEYFLEVLIFCDEFAHVFAY